MSKTNQFDIEQLGKLFELMEKHGLSEVHLKNEDQQWRLRRGPEPGAQVVMAAAPAPAAVPQAAPAPAASPAPAAEAAPVDDGTVLITSEAIGTFYTSPSPEDPPYVNVGDRVTPDRVVCIVEAMKVMNEIHAGVSGTITEVIAKNGGAVAFNDPLFRVQPG